MNKIELHKYTLSFRINDDEVSAMPFMFVDDDQAKDVAVGVLGLIENAFGVTIINGWGEIINTIDLKGGVK